MENLLLVQLSHTKVSCTDCGPELAELQLVFWRAVMSFQLEDVRGQVSQTYSYHTGTQSSL